MRPPLRMSVWLVWVAMTSLVIALAPPAKAAWRAPVAISASGAVRDVKVVVNARGDALAVWLRMLGNTSDRNYLEAVEAAFKPAGGAWQKPTQVTTASGFEAGPASATPALSVAIDPRGGAVLTLIDGHGTFDGGALLDIHREVRVAIRDPNGSWQKPTVLARVPVHEAPVVLDPWGNALVVWDDGSTYPGTVVARFKPAGRDWRKPVLIARDSVEELRVAFDAHGQATVLWWAAWSPGGASGPTIRARVRGPRGVWGKTATLSFRSQLPELAVDPRGDTAVVWDHETPFLPPWVAQASFKPAGGSWRGPFNLSAFASGYSDPQVGLDAHGDAIAIWVSETGQLMSAFKPIGASWRRPETIPGAMAMTGGYSHPTLIVDLRGDAIVRWSPIVPLYQTIPLRVAFRPAGGKWGKPTTLDANPTSWDLAFDWYGRAVAVWTRAVNEKTVVEAATFTGR